MARAEAAPETAHRPLEFRCRAVGELGWGTSLLHNFGLRPLSAPAESRRLGEELKSVHRDDAVMLSLRRSFHPVRSGGSNSDHLAISVEHRGARRTAHDRRVR